MTPTQRALLRNWILLAVMFALITYLWGDGGPRWPFVMWGFVTAFQIVQHYLYWNKGVVNGPKSKQGERPGL